jgi:outer membrane protein assembly factor BamA
MVRFGWIVVLSACGHAAPQAAHPVAPDAPSACTTAAPRPLEVVASTKPVAKVTISGPSAWTYDVQERVKTKAGHVLEREVLEADIRRLWELGIASQIEARVADTEAGPEVELVLSPPLRIARVDGADQSLLAMLRPLEGSLYEPDRLVRLAALAERRLKAHGYWRATVNATAKVACGLASVTFAVNPGRKYKLAAFVVDGSELPIGRSFERALGTANVVGGVLRYEDLVEEANTLLEKHRAHGWIEARRTDPILTYDDARGLVSVRLEYTAGPRYRLGTLAAVGGSTQARARIEALVGPLRDAFYDADVYVAVEKQMNDDVHALGFWVRKNIQFKDHRIDFTYELEAEKP